MEYSLNFSKTKGTNLRNRTRKKHSKGCQKKLGVPQFVNSLARIWQKKTVKQFGFAQAILANNVVAHIDDHHDLCKGVKELLSQKGVFVFEAPYLIDMFENLTFDTIYHEHLSFLAIRPLTKII